MSIRATYKMYPSLLLCLCFVAAASCESRMSSNFFEGDGHVLCDVSKRIDVGCSAKIKRKSRSIVHCLSLCNLDKSCVGASLVENERMSCFHHKECPTISGCALRNSEHKYRRKYCRHGSWNISTELCDCVDGFYGATCEECPRKCSDLLNLGYKYKREGHNVYLDPEHNGKRPFPALCYVYPSTNFTAFMMLRNDGEEVEGLDFNFNKTWADYVNGFYYDNEHMWGGLHAWNRLSMHAGCKKLVLAFKFWNSNGVYRQYYDTNISNETGGYSFTFSHSKRYRHPSVPKKYSFRDCLGSLQDVPFSTWDSDQDGSDDENCAARAGSGWWYSGCSGNPCINALGFRIKYSGTKSRHQLISLLGVDMNTIPSKDGTFHFYLEC